MRVCLNPIRRQDDIPVIADSCRRLTELVEKTEQSSKFDIIKASDFYPETGTFREDQWEQWSWGRRSEILAGKRADAAGQTVILSERSPAALAASVLAGALNLPLVLSSGPEILEEIKNAPQGCSVAVCLLADNAADSLLFSLLDHFHDRLGGQDTWETLPKFSLITGRDISSLSWFVAKLAAQPGLGWGKGSRYGLQHEDVRNGHSATHEIHTGAGHGSIDLARDLEEPPAVVAYSTHGTETCAKGGDSTVLCGKRHENLAFDRDDFGVLACGRGYSCPKAPSPLPLRNVPWKILFLDSCNGIRLADSSTKLDFNLALSFIDSAGLAFVSTLQSGITTETVAQCFLAAMGSGCSLAEATALANAWVTASGTERGSYLAIAMPHEGIDTHGPACAPQALCAEQFKLDGPAVQIHAGDWPMRSFTIDDPQIVAAARERRLALSAYAEADQTGLAWFYRVEKLACPAGDTRSGLAVRIFIFRFPGALQRISLRFVDIELLRARAGCAERNLHRWLNTIELCGVENESHEAITEISQIGAQSQQSIALAALRSRWNGAAAGLLSEQTAVLEQTAWAAAVTALNNLSAKLGGPFWLTNALASAFSLDTTARGQCPYCSGMTLEKTLRHIHQEEHRRVSVCPRCGIIEDVGPAGPFGKIVLESPEYCSTGEDLAVTLRIDPAKAPAADIRFASCARICTNGKHEIPVDAEFQTGVLEGSSIRVPFVFRIPPDVQPHQYAIKAMVVCAGDIAFASRLLFVR